MEKAEGRKSNINDSKEGSTTEKSSTSLARLFKNALYSSGAWIINIGLVLTVTPYFVFKLGSEGYGVYSLLVGLMGYYNLADLGLSQSITKYVAQYKAEDNAAAISYSVNAALLTQVCMGVIISGGLLLFGDTILNLLQVSADFRSSAELGLYICAGSFLFQMVGSTFSSALKGLQRYDLSSKLVMLTETTKNLGIAAALYLGSGLVGAVWAAAFAGVLFFLLNYFMVRRYLTEWRLLNGLSLPYVKELFSFSSFIFISRLADLCQNQVVRFVISFFLGPSAVTYYVIPLKVVKAGAGILSRASNILLPYASELKGLRDQERLQQAFVIGSKTVMTIAVPLFLLIILFSKPLMTVWMGAEFASKTWPYLSLLAIDKIFASFSMVPILIALGIGYARTRAMFSLVAVVLYVVLLPLLTDTFGLYGTVSAAILSATPGLAFIFYVAHVVLNYPIKKFIKKTVVIHVFPCLIAGGVFTAGLNQWIPNTVWGLAIAPAIGLIYISTLYAVGWTPSAHQLRQILRPVS